MVQPVSVLPSVWLLNNIPFNGYTMIYLSISWWALELLVFWAIMNNASINIHVQVLGRHTIPIFKKLFEKLPNSSPRSLYHLIILP